MTAPAHAKTTAGAEAGAQRRWARQAWIYGRLMPAIARLPTRWAYAAAHLRGNWAARTGQDWVEVALGQRYIRERTENAWRLARPASTEPQRRAWSAERYRTWLEEELEALWIARGAWSRFAGLDVEPARTALTDADGRGVVLLQAHFNNPTLACAALGRASQRPVWMTVSGIYQHAQVHPAVRALFEGKYRGAETQLKGGRLLHSEQPTAMRQLYRALERGEVVIVVADLPPEPGQPGVPVPWAGGWHALANGAQRLAARSGARVGTLWLDVDQPGRQRLQVAWPSPQDELAGPETALQAAYHRLWQQIDASPGRWWAAHLLQDTPRCAAPGLDQPDPEHQT